MALCTSDFESVVLTSCQSHSIEPSISFIMLTTCGCTTVSSTGEPLWYVRSTTFFFTECIFLRFSSVVRLLLYMATTSHSKFVIFA